MTHSPDKTPSSIFEYSHTPMYTNFEEALAELENIDRRFESIPFKVEGSRQQDVLQSIYKLQGVVEHIAQINSSGQAVLLNRINTIFKERIDPLSSDPSLNMTEAVSNLQRAIHNSEYALERDDSFCAVSTPVEQLTSMTACILGDKPPGFRRSIFRLSGLEFDIMLGSSMRLTLKGGSFNEETGQLEHSGSFGRIFTTTIESFSDQKMAVKVVSKKTREADFLLQMQNAKHVVSAKFIGNSEDLQFIVMNYIEGCELFDKLLKSTESGVRIPFRDSVSYLLDIARGLQELHKAGIIHNDLKLENVMIEEKTNKAWVVDLGTAQSVNDSLHEIDGTPYYMAPEISSSMFGERIPPNTAVDIYSFGVLAVTLFFGGYIERSLPDIPVSPALCGEKEELSTLLTLCLRRLPGERPRLDEIIDALSRIYNSLDVS